MPAGSAAPTVLADRERITQVLVNLLSNASRHTSGGTISVGVREVDEAAEVSVADTGEGVPPEIAEKLGREPVARPARGRPVGPGRRLVSVC